MDGIHVRRRPGAAFRDDPDETGLFPSALDAVKVPHTPAFIVTAQNLQQVGYCSYLSENGLFFNDQALVNAQERDRFPNKISARTDFENEETGLAAEGSASAIALEFRDRTVEAMKGEFVSLCSLEPTNYGSFRLRVLPKIADHKHILNKRGVVAPLYNNSMRDLYEICGVSLEAIVAHDTHKIYRYDRVAIPSVRNPHFLADLATLNFYAELRERHGTRRRARKIFVSRLGWTASYAATHRIMANEEEVGRRLVAEGFELVLPHTMSVQQQIEAFSSADLIVGASGSAMLILSSAIPEPS